MLFDPWYTGNPSFPESARPKAADLILISHGHSDHITDAEAMAKQTGATVVGIWEVTSWLGSKGVKNVEPMNKGGTITVKGLRITMTDARHSSSADKDLTYLGEAAGFVHQLENGQTFISRRHVAVRRHEVDRRALQTRHRVSADWRSLHDGYQIPRPWRRSGSA